MSYKTLFDKVFESHVVTQLNPKNSLIYIDRHLIHEVTSPQAFSGLDMSNRRVRRADLTFATADHNVSTSVNRLSGEEMEEDSKPSLEKIAENTAKHSIKYFDIMDERQGVVHIIGPEQGITLPGLTIVCGDSHTSTHGAFGAIAFGIGTSEVEHVLASQTIAISRPKNMLININGRLACGVTAKDIILYVISKIGTKGGTGYAIEFGGEVIRNLSMEGRMTVCNMAIEAGAQFGMIAPDEKTFEYLQGRPFAPKGTTWLDAVKYWSTLKSDSDAKFDVIYNFDAGQITPYVTWGTSPEQGLGVDGYVPNPSSIKDETIRQSVERALDYMGLKAGQKISEIKIDRVFIGSCTNGRIEDLRTVAKIVSGKKVASSVRGMIVPGSGLVRKQAEMEGLDKVFLEAGFEWRESGCSMCLAMNADKLSVGERCAATSNRNFEGRQGKGGRTHLMSPAMAAAAAITGYITDIRSL